MNGPKLPPIHPGEILLEEFLKPLELSQYRLAKDMGFPRDASTRSFKENEPSVLARPFAFPAISACRNAFG